MIAELGNYALALSLAVSFFLAIFPLWGAEKDHPQLMSLARPMTYGLFFSLTIAFAALFYLFAVNDFSVQYVVNNSNNSLPIYYRLSAVWGSHEGSLLLWICDCITNDRKIRLRLGKMVSPLDDGGLGLFNTRDCAWFLVGVL